MTHAERLAAAAKLVSNGWTASGAAQQAKVSLSAVERLLGGDA